MLFIGFTFLQLRVCRCPRTNPLSRPLRGRFHYVIQRLYHPPANDITLPISHFFARIPSRSKASGYRSLQTPSRTLRAPHGICDQTAFFTPGLTHPGLQACTRFSTLHEDVSQLCKAVKQWLCGNCDHLLERGSLMLGCRNTLTLETQSRQQVHAKNLPRA